MRHKLQIRGADLKVNITYSQQINKNSGEVTQLITVQVMFDKKARNKSFCYGYSKTREEAVILAKVALNTFLDEIQQALDDAGDL